MYLQEAYTIIQEANAIGKIINRASVGVRNAIISRPNLRDGNSILSRAKSIRYNNSKIGREFDDLEKKVLNREKLADPGHPTYGLEARSKEYDDLQKRADDLSKQRDKFNDDQRARQQKLQKDHKGGHPYGDTKAHKIQYRGMINTLRNDIRKDSDDLKQVIGGKKNFKAGDKNWNSRNMEELQFVKNDRLDKLALKAYGVAGVGGLGLYSKNIIDQRTENKNKESEKKS